MLGHLICIDTYCYGGGWLTAVDLHNRKIWQASREGRLRYSVSLFHKKFPRRRCPPELGRPTLVTLANRVASVRKDSLIGKACQFFLTGTTDKVEVNTRGSGAPAVLPLIH